MISPDVMTFLIMILCGVALSLFFDLLRAIRISLRPNAVIVAISDIIFCAAVMLCAAACVWNFNSGEFRFYEITGLLLGGVFYFFLLSKWILKFFLLIIENILKFVRLISKILLTPPRFLYKILVVPTQKYAGRIQQRSHRAHDKRIQRQGNKFHKKS